MKAVDAIKPLPSAGSPKIDNPYFPRHWSPALLLGPLTVFLALATSCAAAEKKTVCTVTVNSADEKEMFRRHLPASKYQFIELVERGRPDWLASACRASISCDVLIISGHYDGGNEFFSDRLDVHEFLPVSELERVSCNDSCPGVFSKLKDVYLFGCNTLNPQAQSNASAEVVRSLVREGHSPKEAQNELQSLNAVRWDSSLDRMRQIFKDVPVIYGFSSTAPLGTVAASTLDRYFKASGAIEIAQGHPSERLLSYFSSPMAATKGMTDADPHAGARIDMCQFADDRLSQASKLAFVHQLLQRNPAQARLYLQRIQLLTNTLDEHTRQTPPVAKALDAIAGDSVARARFLNYVRAGDQPTVRTSLVNLARDVGWLSEDERWNELALMLGELLSRSSVGMPEVDLACSLNQDHTFDGAFNRRAGTGKVANDLPHAAVRACLGSSEGHARTLQGLVSPSDADVQIAQTYLLHRPVTDLAELREITVAIVRMEPSAAQARALDTLSRHYLSDRELLEMLTGLYAQTSSWSVQTAIAGILIRSDLTSIARPQLLRSLIENRRPSPPDEHLIDALIRTLHTS